MPVNLIREVTGYETSKDYIRLFELAQQESIICLCRGDGEMKDIAHTIFDEKYFAVSSRGTGYVCADNPDDFIRQCRQCDL
jgi:hypothetical protein